MTLHAGRTLQSELSTRSSNLSGTVGRDVSETD